MPRINLLPWREELRRERQQEFYKHLGMAVAAGAAVVAYGIFTVDGMVSYQNSRNDFLKREIAQVDEKIKEISELQTTKERLLARMQVIEQLQQSRPEIVHLFDELVRTLPDGVYLTSVRQTSTNLEIKGVAESSARVSTYMRNIDASDWLGIPTLDVIEAKEQERTRHFEFSLRTKQISPHNEKDAENAG